jgi:hypothetical protein
MVKEPQALAHAGHGLFRPMQKTLSTWLPQAASRV